LQGLEDVLIWPVATSSLLAERAGCRPPALKLYLNPKAQHLRLKTVLRMQSKPQITSAGCVQLCRQARGAVADADFFA